MMKSIVEEKLVSFKELEQKIFKYVCELGREMTQIMLSPTMRNLHHQETQNSTVTRENVKRP